MIEFLKQKDKYVLCGNYRAKIGSNFEDVDPAQFFRYNIITERSTNFDMLIDNLVGDRSALMIKTNARLNWAINAYVSTQDGKLYTITAIDERVQAQNGASLMFVKTNPSTEYIITLLECNNDMGLK